MIAKELDPFYSNDKFQIAGRKAEEQMTFYLRRYFASSDEIYVTNGLKIHADGESAQIDHLHVEALTPEFGGSQCCSCGHS